MKKYLSPNLVFASCITFLFFASSCAKSNVAPNLNTGKYYVKFSANGAAKEFRTDGTVSHYLDSVTISGKKVYTYSLACAMLSSNYTAAETITIGIFSDKKWAAGSSYKESVRVSGYQSSTMLIYDPHPGTYARLNAASFDPSGILYPTLTRDVVVTITAVTSTSVSGTFSGTVYQENATGEPNLSDKTTLASGEFFLGLK